MKEIGGYFGLELPSGDHFHTSALHLNSGRGALEYIARSKNLKKVHVPIFTCSAIIEQLEKLGVEIKLYRINESLEFEAEDFDKNDSIIYTNYFGIKSEFIRSISSKFSSLIIDNAQAFFAEPVVGMDTLYSPRKFFGVPDGGYLFTDNSLDIYLESDFSASRADHLFERIDSNAMQGFEQFLRNELAISNQPLKKMSNLTDSLLRSINYQKARISRNENFNFFHKTLSNVNELANVIDIVTIDGPMVYPLLNRNGRLRETLIENNIFIPTYWPNVLDSTMPNDWEYYLSSKLVPLPVDQRYTLTDLDRVLSVVKSCLK